MIKRVDENGNVRLITNIRKPRKWRRFEYLESSGTQWIDTGIIANQYPIELKTNLCYTDNATSEKDFFGNFSGGNSSTCFVCGKINNQFYQWGGNSFKVGTVVQNQFYELSYKYNGTTGRTLTIDGTANTSTANNGFTSRTDTIGVFSGASTRAYCAASVKMKYSQILINDILVRDFVPAQYNGQYGMWDLVEDKFYGNSGTGTFTVGPEIKNYDEIYEVRRTSSIFPAGVELYDYIGNDGSQWIDTGYASNSDTKIETQISSSITSPIEFYGSSNNTGANFRLFVLNHLYAASGKERAQNAFSSSINTVYTAIHTHTSLIINGTSYSTASGSNFSGDSIKLFRDPGYVGQYYFVGKFYYCKIWNGSTLVRNFLPCTYLGEPGMWDTVENKFYRNQGTGQFTLGNKITLKEYESITASGAQYINTNYYPNVNTKLILRRSDHSSNFINDGEIDGNQGQDGAFYVSGTQFAFDKFKVISSIRNVNSHVIQLSSDGLFINGSFIDKQTDYRNNWTSPREFYLMALNRGNSIDPNYNTIYYCKLYDNNQLVRDFIPVSYNGTPGLWDKVEWKFYENAGSGSFTLGPEKASGIYPVWTPIEYLQSSGTQYIDTKYVFKNTDVIDVTYDNIASGFVFGSRKSSSSEYSGITNESNGEYRIRYGNKTIYGSSSQPFGTVVVHIESGDTKINGSSVSTTTYGSEFYNGNCYLFTMNNNGTAFSGAYGTNRIRRFSIQGICDMIPVRIGTTGYMFDRVTGKMYGNSGTGNFILGPDINL